MTDPRVDAILNLRRVVRCRVNIPLANPMVYKTLGEYLRQDLGGAIHRWRRWARQHRDAFVRADAPPRPRPTGQ